MGFSPGDAALILVRADADRENDVHPEGEEQIEDENTVLTWRVPLLIGAPLVALLICVMVGYIIYQQWRLRYDVMVGCVIYQ